MIWSYDHLLSTMNVMVGRDHQILAKIVCVRNNRNKKDWIAFISTDPTLSLIRECHSLSYDALTAHVAIVFARCIRELSLEVRKLLETI